MSAFVDKIRALQLKASLEIGVFFAIFILSRPSLSERREFGLPFTYGSSITHPLFTPNLNLASNAVGYGYTPASSPHISLAGFTPSIGPTAANSFSNYLTPAATAYHPSVNQGSHFTNIFPSHANSFSYGNGFHQNMAYISPLYNSYTMATRNHPQVSPISFSSFGNFPSHGIVSHQMPSADISFGANGIYAHGHNNVVLPSF